MCEHVLGVLGLRSLLIQDYSGEVASRQMQKQHMLEGSDGRVLQKFSSKALVEPGACKAVHGLI